MDNDKFDRILICSVAIFGVLMLISIITVNSLGIAKDNKKDYIENKKVECLFGVGTEGTMLYVTDISTNYRSYDVDFYIENKIDEDIYAKITFIDKKGKEIQTTSNNLFKIGAKKTINDTISIELPKNTQDLNIEIIAQKLNGEVICNATAFVYIPVK